MMSIGIDESMILDGTYRADDNVEL